MLVNIKSDAENLKTMELQNLESSLLFNNGTISNVNINLNLVVEGSNRLVSNSNYLVTHSSFSADGQWLVVAYNQYPWAEIFHKEGENFSPFISTGFNPSGEIYSCAISSKGDYVVLGRSGFWSMYYRQNNTFTTIMNSTGPGITTSVEFSKDDKFLIICRGLYLHVWYLVETGRYAILGNYMPNFGNVEFASLSPNNIYLATAYNNSIKVFKIQLALDNTYSFYGPIFETTLPGVIRGVKFSPDCQYFCVIGGTSPYYNFFSYRNESFTQLTRANIDGENPITLSFSNDGEQVLLVGTSGFRLLRKGNSSGVFESEGLYTISVGGSFLTGELSFNGDIFLSFQKTGIVDSNYIYNLNKISEKGLLTGDAPNHLLNLWVNKGNSLVKSISTSTGEHSELPVNIPLNISDNNNQINIGIKSKKTQKIYLNH